MTDHEKAIVSAYTGIAMLAGDKFQIFHKYIEDLLGRSVWTHELADPAICEEIKEKSKKDFLDLCSGDKEIQLNNMRLIDANKLLKEVRENKELFENERVYLEGLLLNAETYNQVGHKMATAEGFCTNPEWNKGDLISREALLEAFSNSKHIKETTSGLDVMEMLAIKEVIDNAPTVEPAFKPIAEVKFNKEQLQELVDKAKAEILASVKRPQGKWKFKKFDEETGIPNHDWCPFCGYCGADMRGEEE